MAGVLKKTTNLTGLAVAKHPHHTLSVLYNKILRALQKIPQEAAYRKYTEDVIKNRLSIVESEKDVEKLEQKINGGQVEELIIQKYIICDPPHRQNWCVLTSELDYEKD
ncbi:NADH dehydrogenase [ubiquinone] 1 alpha subcomplex subunit 5-like [Centruroides sculpturatus]|uniref:NADH dehydrogenase [ubiquinone] 1 alpha subcomplex subunit 5-like n=1 Tax=Centruroides sculpturatus TaxID=218467 RepID=UPI000C6D42FE|nr:NADH dehydrogenase [ubiquinone] 1 alpha subcomplex subunit 5-like [Centruroides sculpturatus]